jgi:hypothetical protein
MRDRKGLAEIGVKDTQILWRRDSGNEVRMRPVLWGGK